MNLLDLYEKFLEEGTMNTAGLCNVFTPRSRCKRLFKRFHPTDEDKMQINREGKCTVFWASGVRNGAAGEGCGFSGLRQNIVLLMAAEKGHL